jgi:hypothetical protein
VVDQIESGGAVGRLTDAGRALHFGDDIRMEDGKFSGPYSQLSGTFRVKALKIEEITGDQPDLKIVDAKIGVVIDHPCFTKPLPVMGIDRGDFSEDTAPRLRMRQKGDWLVEQVLH